MLLRLSSAVPAIKEMGALDLKAKRPLSLVSTLVLHRQNVGATAEEVARFFLDRKYGTGGKMPYHFIVRMDGSIEQAVPLGLVAPGALKLNRSGVQIALHGDFRNAAPSDEQFYSVVSLVAVLRHAFNVAAVTGHTNGPGATKTPGKVCPGKHLDIKKIRELSSTKPSLGATYCFVL